MNIRAATAREVYDLFRSDYGSDQLFPMLFDTDRLKQCDQLFVAEIDGSIVGAIAMASRGCDGSRGPTLATLYTPAAFQRRGVGRALCEFGIRRFAESGKVPIHCDVISRAMNATIKRLPSDLQTHLIVDLSYKLYGDEWEDR